MWDKTKKCKNCSCLVSYRRRGRSMWKKWLHLELQAGGYKIAHTTCDRHKCNNPDPRIKKGEK